MNAKEALEKLYAGDYQTEEGAGELARIVSEALRDAESTESLYLSTLAELSAIKKRARELKGKDIDGKTLNEIIDFIINGPKEGEGK